MQHQCGPDHTAGELILILLNAPLGIVYLWKQFVAFKEEITSFS